MSLARTGLASFCYRHHISDIHPDTTRLQFSYNIKFPPLLHRLVFTLCDHAVRLKSLSSYHHRHRLLGTSVPRRWVFRPHEYPPSTYLRIHSLMIRTFFILLLSKIVRAMIMAITVLQIRTSVGGICTNCSQGSEIHEMAYDLHDAKKGLVYVIAKTRTAGKLLMRSIPLQSPLDVKLERQPFIAPMPRLLSCLLLAGLPASSRENLSFLLMIMTSTEPNSYDLAIMTASQVTLDRQVSRHKLSLDERRLAFLDFDPKSLKT